MQARVSSDIYTKKRAGASIAGEKGEMGSTFSKVFPHLMNDEKRKRCTRIT